MLRNVGYGLGVVAWRMSAENGLSLELKNFIGGSSYFEWACFLEVLGFEEEGALGETVDLGVGEEGSAVNEGFYSLVGLDNCLRSYLLAHR